MVVFYKFDPMDKEIPVKFRVARVIYHYYKNNKNIELTSSSSGYSLSACKSYIREYLDKWPEEKVNALFDPDYSPYEVREETKLPRFSDEYTRPEMPSKCGLYLIGSTYFNPITGENYYYIKIGRSNDLQKRIKQYSTYNPMLWIADVKTMSEKQSKAAEAYYHILLSEICYAKAPNCDEWYLIDRDNYLDICANGFGWFEEM